VVVYDSLEYCATLNNLSSVKDCLNFKVRHVDCIGSPVLDPHWRHHTRTKLYPRNFVYLQFVKGNISTADLVRYVLESEEIDTVMHFAAQVRLQSRRVMLAASSTDVNLATFMMSCSMPALMCVQTMALRPPPTPSIYADPR